MPAEQPTKKQQLRDAKALINGKRDGKIVIENINLKTSAGKYKVVDQKFTDSAEFKETEDAKFEEWPQNHFNHQKTPESVSKWPIFGKF